MRRVRSKGSGGYDVLNKVEVLSLARPRGRGEGNNSVPQRNVSRFIPVNGEVVDREQQMVLRREHAWYFELELMKRISFRSTGVPWG